MLKKLFTGIVASSAIASGASAAEKETRIVEYPGFSKLTIEVPADWKTYDQKRVGVFSADKKLEVSGSAFGTNGQPIEDFTENKHQGITQKMHWYKATTELTKIEHPKYSGYIKEYQGIWPKEDIPTTYIVSTIGMDGIAMSLTFTGFTKDIDTYREQVKDIIKSVQLKK